MFSTVVLIIQVPTYNIRPRTPVTGGCEHEGEWVSYMFNTVVSTSSYLRCMA